MTRIMTLEKHFYSDKLKIQIIPDSQHHRSDNKRDSQKYVKNLRSSNFSMQREDSKQTESSAAFESKAF